MKNKLASQVKYFMAVSGLVFSVLLTGCSKDNAAEEDSAVQENSKSDSDKQLFSFVDAHGEEYEVELNEDIKACEYDKSLFVEGDNKMAYEDDTYVTMQGIDVSHHQGDIDFSAVKSAGYDFVIMRIGYRGYGEEGALCADEKFEEYYTAAKAAGLKVGAYFFAQAINEKEAEEEAEFVLGILNKREMDLPVCYDPESILDDEARTDDVTGEQFTENTKAFCEAIEEGGYDSMIYANMVWEALKLDLTELEDYPIWYADYVIPAQTPYAFVAWQYSENGSVPGVQGVCDLDIWIEKK